MSKCHIVANLMWRLKCKSLTFFGVSNVIHSIQIHSVIYIPKTLSVGVTSQIDRFKYISLPCPLNQRSCQQSKTGVNIYKHMTIGVKNMDHVVLHQNML